MKKGESNSRTLVLLVILATMMGNLFAKSDADLIPPEILEQMDPDIRAGKRPSIGTIRQNDIFKLRENPKFEEDFVTFDFKVDAISTVQLDIIKNWIRSGNNKVMLIGEDIGRYGPLLEPVRSTRASGPGKLLRHSVNTDCKDIRFSRSKDSSVCDCLTNLAPDAIVIAEAESEKAICGFFRLGEGSIFFRNYVFNTPDSRRWLLNWLHWIMGLGVPGTATTEILGSGSSGLTLEKAAQYDALILKNGDTVTGIVENDNFKMKASYGELLFETPNIAKIVFEGAGNNIDVIRLKVGDRISGLVQDAKIKIKLVSGSSLEVDKDKVKEIQIRKTDRGS